MTHHSKRKLNMKKQLLAVSLICGLSAFSGIASAKGCLKGAAVGGVAGHVAGHHSVLGAAAGCVVGRHQANKKGREQAAAQTTTTATSSRIAPATNR
jgi:hypothetical protein